MNRKSAVFILMFFIVTALAISAPAEQTPRRYLFRDGFNLSGVDGKVTLVNSNCQNGTGKPDRWLFELGSDVSDDRGAVKAGTSIELLPSATLEKLLADTKNGSDADCRLWGIATKYKSKNFIFPIYFLPLGKVEETQTEPKQQQQQEISQENVTVNDPNDALAIPDEIAKKLSAASVRTQRRISNKQLKKTLELKQDFILADRTGFIFESSQESQFVLDALGRNIGQFSFELLACETLERAERKQSTELEQVRFKTAGIVTQYKGRHYLLLQRARQAYSHGNFKN